jgi:hypothetical protein
MQIQLKQNEIVAAITQYVAKQGINLTGRKVEVTFTAGRKESGLSADVDITDMELPDLAPDVVAPALTVVKSDAPEAEPVVEAQSTGPTKASSLFG